MKIGVYSSTKHPEAAIGLFIAPGPCLMVIVGNLSFDELEDMKTDFESIARRTFNRVAAVMTGEGTEADRFEIGVRFGPFDTKPSFDTARRKAQRFIREELGGTINQLQ